MNEARRNVLVGLFVLVGLGSLATLIVLFGQHTAFLLRREAYTVEVRFSSAAGIRPGTVATIGGLDVGRVTSVDFVDRNRFDIGVAVVVAFERDIVLRRGARARTTEPGMGMGRPPIVIEPGPTDAEPLAAGAVIYGEMTGMVESLIPPDLVVNFDRMRVKLEEAATALTPVLDDMHELLQRRGTGVVDAAGGPPGNISTAVERLDGALKHVNTVLGDPDVQSQLKRSVENFEKMTDDGRVLAADLRSAVSEAREVVTQAKAIASQAQTTLTNIDESVTRVARGLVADLDAASRLLDRLNLMAEGMAAGQGTIGQLMTDPRLYEAMVVTFQRLSETVGEFKLLVQEWQKGRIKVGF
ncbi:MAG: MCE family protein [Phycisphaerae bacterium]|jgi:ABC-type transporter Mla subunit MlaD